MTIKLVVSVVHLAPLIAQNSLLRKWSLREMSAFRSLQEQLAKTCWIRCDASSAILFSVLHDLCILRRHAQCAPFFFAVLLPILFCYLRISHNCCMSIIPFLFTDISVDIQVLSFASCLECLQLLTLYFSPAFSTLLLKSYS